MNKDNNGRWALLRKIHLIREKYRWQAAITIVSIFLLTSFIDYITPEEITFLPFYLFPVLLTALIFNMKWTIVAGLSTGLLFITALAFGRVTHPELPTSFLWINLPANLLVIMVASISFRLVFELLEKSTFYEDFISNILNHIPYGVITADSNGIIVQFNDTAKAITGYQESEIIGFHADEIRKKLFPNNWDVECFNNGSAIDKGSFSLEYELKHKDGRIIPLSIASCPICEQGEIIGVINIFRGITKEKELEKARNEMLSVLSHDLRTPFSIIISYAYLLERKDLKDEEREKYAKGISVSTHMTLGLLENLLEDARQKDGKAVIFKTNFDYSKLARSVAQIFESLAVAKNIEVKVEMADNLLVNGDQEKIRQVLFNLISNAIKYSPEGSKIRILATLENSKVITKVADTGSGIPTNFLPKLFERFSRIEGKEKGAGLGMYITKKLVEAHGGQIDVSSKEGEGTIFTFTLPAGTSTSTFN